MPLLECRGLGIDRPGFSLRLDLRLEPGEVLALIGPSGSGKTTALRLVAGLERATRGSALLRGGDALMLPPEKRGMGMVSQDFALFPHLDCLGNAAYGLRARGMGRAEAHARASAMLKRMGLGGFERRRIDSLSGGEAQRLALARSLAIEPDILLLDEAFGSLDAPIRAELMELVLEAARGFKMGVLMVTHDQAEALRAGTRVAVMEGGRVVQEGSPEELYRKPRDAFVARFTGASTLVASRLEPDGSVLLPGLGVRLGPGLASIMESAGSCGEGEALAAIRPESIRPSGSAAGGFPRFEARVVGSRFEGRSWLVEARSGKERVWFYAERAYEAGGEIGLALDPQAVVIVGPCAGDALGGRTLSVDN
jgi:putative spermidine/putrescine transport system ATP-binding protein